MCLITMPCLPLSVSLSLVTIWELLNEFQWSLMLVSFTEFYQHTQILVLVGQQYRSLCMKIYMCFCVLKGITRVLCWWPYSMPAQLGSRRGPICKEDKRFRAAILFVVTRVRLVGEMTGWYFEFVCLKMKFHKHFLCYVQIYKESVPKSQLYYLNFKTKFLSQAKGNPWVGHMLCRPVILLLSSPCNLFKMPTTLIQTHYIIFRSFWSYQYYNKVILLSKSPLFNVSYLYKYFSFVIIMLFHLYITKSILAYHWKCLLRNMASMF
jgi:hypothetical protein